MAAPEPSLPALRGAVALFLEGAVILAPVFCLYSLSYFHIQAEEDTEELCCPHPDVLMQGETLQVLRGKMPEEKLKIINRYNAAINKGD